jgi:hypothetical protein
VDIATDLASASRDRVASADLPPTCLRRSDCRAVRLTVTGESTYWMLPSSMRISLALMHRSLTAASGMISQRRSCSICLPRQLGRARTHLSRSEAIVGALPLFGHGRSAGPDESGDRWGKSGWKDDTQRVMKEGRLDWRRGD